MQVLPGTHDIRPFRRDRDDLAGTERVSFVSRRYPGHDSGADPREGSRRHCFLLSNRLGSELGGRSYLRTPKLAPQSWVSITVPTIGPMPLEKPVRLRTCTCGRGMSVGKPLLG